MREAIGVGNSRVGYVYLVDGLCRVRWAGSGNAKGREKESLVKGVRKLAEEWKVEQGLVPGKSRESGHREQSKELEDAKEDIEQEIRSVGAVG